MNRRTGDFGESVVCDFLVRHGYEILERNFTVRGGEIDIIAYKKDIDTLAFVEVKTRAENALVSGEEAVTSAKKKHIVRTAEIYLSKNLNESCGCRFDVAVVQVSDKSVKSLKYYAGAFDASKA